MEYTGRIYLLHLKSDGAEKAGPGLALGDPDTSGEIEFLLIVKKKAASARDLPLLPGDLKDGTLPEESSLSIKRKYYVKESDLEKPVASVTPEFLERALRACVIDSALRHFEVKHKKTSDFSPGQRIGYAGRVFDEKEVENLIDSSLDFWLTTGRYADLFEKKFARMLGVRHCMLANSGSSANLLAFMALTSPILGDRRVKKGDEIITVAAGFPTTVAPMIQFGAIPVFVDVSFPTANIDVNLLEKAVSPKTRAVMVAHTLGNPFNLHAVKEFCVKHNLWLVEDNCDALGAKYFMDGEWVYTGSIGDLATSSFYPPHHITMGEGGAVYTNAPRFKRIVESFRDWGRDCWCPSGKDNTCAKRFNWELGELPQGYDHKYIYSHFGYNLKVTDMQAAIGVAQLDKLSSFVEARNRNWETLRRGLSHLSDYFILPEATADSRPSWFGFMLTLRPEAPFKREEIVRTLEDRGIQTRMLFAGNLVRHPCFDEMRASGEGYRVSGSLTNTDRIMNDSFWVGVYPGMTESMISYMIDSIAGCAGPQKNTGRVH